MNADNASQTSLQAEQKAHEPSMEDILASIRKIIADDDALPLSRRAAPARPEPLPACDEPVAAALSARRSGAVVPPPVPVAPVPTPAIATRGPGPLKPPPIPSLRELAQRLDELPSSCTPGAAASRRPRPRCWSCGRRWANLPGARSRRAAPKRRPLSSSPRRFSPLPPSLRRRKPPSVSTREISEPRRSVFRPTCHRRRILRPRPPRRCAFAFGTRLVF